MQILNSTIADAEAIFDLYDIAIAFQKAVSKQYWLPFDKQLVLNEIAEHRQWKIMVDGQIACIFVTAYSDADIWVDNLKLKAVYLNSGFKYSGTAPPANPEALPSHYSTIILGYFEMVIE